MLHLLDRVDDLTRVLSRTKVAVQGHQQAATAQANLVVTQRLGMPLQRAAAGLGRNFERLALLRGTSPAGRRAARSATTATATPASTTTGPPGTARASATAATSTSAIAATARACATA